MDLQRGIDAATPLVHIPGPMDDARSRLHDSRRVGLPAMDRRRFLLLVGAAGACAALQPLDALARRTRSLTALQPWTLPPEVPTGGIEVARALIGAAVLAPSDWNTQPWLFEVDGSSIRLVADPSRALAVTDPDRRGMMLALGAALENLLVAARAWGLRPSVIYRPHEAANGVMAEVSWMPGDQRRDRSLFGMIRERRTNRSDYDGRGLFPQHRAQLTAQVPEGLSVHWVDDRARMARIADLVHDATRRQMSDRRAQQEQYGWLRFDGEEKRRGDGVPVRALGFSGPAEWFASRYFDPRSVWRRFGADSAAKQARGQIRSSGALALLTATRDDEATRLMGGQTFQRFALKATGFGLAHHALSAPVEVEAARAPLLAEFGAAGEDPLLLVRLGHARAPRPVPRRAVGVVASFRTT